MTCPCPKCSAPIEQELAQVQEDASPIACPACKAKVLVMRESFARRAYRKSADIRCSECGGELRDSVNCPSCGALYPDYIVADTPEAIRKRKQAAKKYEPFKGLEFSLRPTARGGDTGYVPHRAESESAAVVPISAGSRNLIMGAIALVIGIAVLAGGVGAYRHYQASRRYAETYTKALYGIKTGVEDSTGVSMKIAEDWKKKQEAGTGVQPRPNADDEARLNKLKGQVDALVQKLQQPPDKFAAANDRLMKLNEIYGKAHTLALAPSGSPQGFSESAAKLQGDFTQAGHELKSALPGPLAEELKKAEQKYRGLRDL